MENVSSIPRTFLLEAWNGIDPKLTASLILCAADILFWVRTLISGMIRAELTEIQPVCWTEFVGMKDVRHLISLPTHQDDSKLGDMLRAFRAVITLFFF